jgi:hypothetical protein
MKDFVDFEGRIRREKLCFQHDRPPSRAYPEIGKAEEKKKVSDRKSPPPKRLGTPSLLCCVCGKRCTIHRPLGTEECEMRSGRR